jgi:ABC-type amino acid transport substrate-binding protein
MKSPVDTFEQEEQPARRGFLAAAAGLGMLGGGVALSTLATTAPAAAQDAPQEALVDKWLRTKKCVVGAQMTQVPLSFVDEATGKPSGFLPTLFTMIIADLHKDIEIEWVSLPFGELIPAWISGRFDMLGQTLGATPSRALQGWFTTVPSNYASGVVVVRQDTTITSYADLNNSAVRFAALQGGTEAAAIRKLYPAAQLSEFSSAADAGSEVSIGRADAMVMSAHNVPSVINARPNLKVLAGDPIYVDGSGYMLPQGDIKTLLWMNNWLTQASIKGTLKDEWSKWFVPALAPYNLVASVSGPMGYPVPVDTAAAAAANPAS